MATEDDIDLDDLLNDALNDFEDDIEIANAKKLSHTPDENYTPSQRGTDSPTVQNVLERAYQEINETHERNSKHTSVDEANDGPSDAEPGLDVESKVAETLKNMAKAAEEAGGLESTDVDQMGEEMMKEMLEGLGEMGDKGNFQDLVDNMMQQLLNKEVMYDPIKQICDRYPEWLVEKKSTLSKEDYERFWFQYQLFQQVVDVYASEPENYTKLSELMQEIQDCGHPPTEIVKELAPGLQFGADGMPELPNIESMLSPMSGLQEQINANDSEEKTSIDPGETQVKKRGLPPPSNPPPQKSTSAAAAFRSKSSLPPPKLPPPEHAIASTSVNKIRGAVRPPTIAPPDMKPPPKQSLPLKSSGKKDEEEPSSRQQKNADVKEEFIVAEDKASISNVVANPSKKLEKLSRSNFIGSGSKGILREGCPASQEYVDPLSKESTIQTKSLSEVLLATTASLSTSKRKSRQSQESDETTPAIVTNARPVSLTSVVRPGEVEEEMILVHERTYTTEELYTAGEQLSRGQELLLDGDEIEEIPFLEINTCDTNEGDSVNDYDDEKQSEDGILIQSDPQEGKDTTEDFNLNEQGQRLETRAESNNDGRKAHDEVNENDTAKRSCGSGYVESVTEKEEEEASNLETTTNEPGDRNEENNRKESQYVQKKRLENQFYNPKDVPFSLDELFNFVKKPLQRGSGRIVKCFIERNSSGPNRLAPMYTLLLEVNSSSGRPILYARKKAISPITSHYVISMNKSLTRLLRSRHFVGKLRSNSNTKEYYLYDQGDNPDDIDSDCEIDDEMRKHIRAELCVVRYALSKKSYPRKMEVVIPALAQNGSCALDWRPLSKDQMIEKQIRSIVKAGGQNVTDYKNFVFFHKRETKYDPLSSCIVDFRSRATCVSVKNFQLIHSEPLSEMYIEAYRAIYPDHVYEDQGTASLPLDHLMLQLGKVGKDCFNMDFQYPLSMLQAFAICLSRFDTKQI
uniref:Uncharacterized protein AlNc14C38G3326 n=1 Tax=Albugo laibachii Nc14 TaxID=890382 RepID=F0W959_9STRA|nr:conserved hypothetical protein [Albugo laibachii Nc14]|eukprot:CCA17672.1 conserved hypothetical protein [Albugo laibachii Nc14]